MTDEDADGELQPMAYAAGRKALGEPVTDFAFQVLQPPNQRSPLGMIYEIPVAMRPVQVDRFQLQLLQIAREIAWRAENDVWHGAVPWAWWCSQTACGFWNSCTWRGAA